MKTSGDKIRELCEKTKLSQREFAKKVDIPYSTFCNVINNYNTPSLWTLTKIADEFDIELNTLFGEEDGKIASSIGEKIKILRRNEGLTQEQLAEIAGISRKTVDNLENNRRIPIKVTLLKIVGVLGCRVEELIP